MVRELRLISKENPTLSSLRTRLILICVLIVAVAMIVLSAANAGDGGFLVGDGKTEVGSVMQGKS